MNNHGKEYTFLWFIENYSYCYHKNGEALFSPEFTFDGLEGTVWAVELYPRGRKEFVMGEISVYLYRKDDDGPDFFTLSWQMSFIAEDGSILNCFEHTASFSKKYGKGWLNFLEIDDDLLKQIPRGILTVRCRLWNGKGYREKVAPICARTRIGIEHIPFLLAFEDFSTLESNLKKTVQTRSRSKKRSVITSSVYCYEERIMLQITPSDPDHILAKCKVSLLDISGCLVKCAEADNRSDADRKEIEKLPLSLTKNAIMCKKSEYLLNDTLSLLCECTFSSGIEFQEIEGAQSEITTMAVAQLSNYPHIKEKLSACPSALDDLKEIYNGKFLTDVELKTKANSFPVHKMVLCARSPVFSVMMSSDMKEKNSDSIQVDDLEDDTVEQLLLFLYSDKIEDLQWETAIKLYYAADKYQIQKLKLICSSFLLDNLSTSTVTELLLLADAHNDSDFKMIVEDFVLEHDKQVFSSEEWEKLLEKNPQLALKTMHLKYKKKK